MKENVPHCTDSVYIWPTIGEHVFKDLSTTFLHYYYYSELGTGDNCYSELGTRDNCRGQPDQRQHCCLLPQN